MKKWIAIGSSCVLIALAVLILSALKFNWSEGKTIITLICGFMLGAGGVLLIVALLVIEREHQLEEMERKDRENDDNKHTEA